MLYTSFLFHSSPQNINPKTWIRSMALTQSSTGPSFSTVSIVSRIPSIASTFRCFLLVTDMKNNKYQKHKLRKKLHCHFWLIDSRSTMEMFSRFPSQCLDSFLCVSPLQHKASAVQMCAVAERIKSFLQQKHREGIHVHGRCSGTCSL